jgi:hypothetical protein
MDLNPYQPPLVAVPTLADEQSSGKRPALRPIGIWLLSGLHLLFGVLFVVLTLFALRQSTVYPWIYPLWMTTICGLMAVMAVATSIGLWLGQRWGWWLAAFYYVWGSLGVVADSLLVFSRLGHVDAESVANILPSKLIQLAIHLLILVYLFKGTVRAFFHLQSISTLKSLLLLGFVAIVVLSATYGATIMLQTEQP